MECSQGPQMLVVKYFKGKVIEFVALRLMRGDWALIISSFRFSNSMIIQKMLLIKYK